MTDKHDPHYEARNGPPPSFVPQIGSFSKFLARTSSIRESISNETSSISHLVLDYPSFSFSPDHQTTEYNTVTIGHVTVVLYDAPELEPVKPSTDHSHWPSYNSSRWEKATERVLQGIYLHEQGDLTGSAWLINKAADALLPLALYFMGLSSRHGWGLRPNASRGFYYLHRAAECQIYVANKTNLFDINSIRVDLGMILFEMANCYQRGWGVAKSKPMTIYYLQLASQLGDPDAQNELGFCYLKGWGIKRDKYNAAKYFRLAEKQGSKIMGLSWIHKSKYD